MKKINVRPIVKRSTTIEPQYWRCWSCNEALWWIQPTGNKWTCATCHPPLKGIGVSDFSSKHPEKFKYPPYYY